MIDLRVLHRYSFWFILLTRKLYQSPTPSYFVDTSIQQYQTMKHKKGAYTDINQGITMLMSQKIINKWINKPCFLLAGLRRSLAGLAAVSAILHAPSCGIRFSWIFNYPTLIPKLVFYARLNNNNTQRWSLGDLRILMRRQTALYLRDYYLNVDGYQ